EPRDGSRDVDELGSAGVLAGIGLKRERAQRRERERERERERGRERSANAATVKLRAGRSSSSALERVLEVGLATVELGDRGASRTREEALEGGDARGVEADAGLALALSESSREALRLVVRALGGHRVAGVGEIDDPRLGRDRFADEALGIAFAVEALV